MTPEQIRLIQHSFEKIRLNPETMTRRFYDRLFELDPELKPLFKSDRQEQEFKLISMLQVIVRDLDQLDYIIEGVQKLALRHVNYGVTAQHYETVGLALLEALEQSLQADFTVEVRTAWVKAYDLLTDLMTEAVY
jgi:hemoglobin-like flavoprotein